MDLKKLLSIILILLGGYYLLIVLQVIPAKVVFGNYSPNNQILSVISIIIILSGLLLNDNFRKKIKDAFS